MSCTQGQAERQVKSEIPTLDIHHGSGQLPGSSEDKQKIFENESGISKKKESIYKAENKSLVETLRKRGADVRGTDRGVVINLPDVIFEFDSSVIKPQARIHIDEISRVLKEVKKRNISIEGHTDSIGKVSYNKQLSLKRAQMVLSEIQRNGVSTTNYKVRGIGEGYPIATNNSEEGRKRNRRVEIIIEN
jgi:outer membrane protein OmpA-like peptidoglycan-associated protein